MDDFKSKSYRDATSWDWKCSYIFNSRWKNDTRMFHQLARARMKEESKREIKEAIEGV